jgi:UDP-N-acetylmuramoylalanine--D-glutamate ligase
VKISELEGKRVAIWGYGREGRAALAALRWRLPSQPITVFCSEAEAAAIKAMEDPALTIDTQVDGDKLAAFEIVIKSPGISPYLSPAVDAQLQGTRFVGGTALWFGENSGQRTICVTGTKGKSTVTALIAHLLRSAGRRTALAGNIGMPLLELLDVEPAPQFW